MFENQQALQRGVDGRALYRRLFGELQVNLYAGSGGSGSDQALLSLGQRLYKQGNNQVAQLAFERAIKANPENAEAYYELGTLLYFGKEDDKRAKEVLAKYLQIGKDQGHMDNAKNFLVVLEKRSK